MHWKKHKRIIPKWKKIKELYQSYFEVKGLWLILDSYSERSVILYCFYNYKTKYQFINVSVAKCT